jgi:hypothetical protein
MGHGAIFDAQGKLVEPTPAFVLKVQTYYLKRLQSQATEAQRKEFSVRQISMLEIKPQSSAEKIVANASLIASLLEIVQPADASAIGSKNTALLGRFVVISNEGAKAKNSQIGMLRKAFVIGLRKRKGLNYLSATQSGGSAYIEECGQAGVPIPPSWGSNQWKSRGSLKTNFLKSSGTPEAELFVFESAAPRGVCMALPRSGGNTIKALGIVCMGLDTGKSCFWDNQRSKSQFDIQKGSSVSLSEFAGGADLYGGSGNVCTDCHAGENAFVVHPEDAMDLGSGIVPKKWNEPLVHPKWPQNTGPSNQLQGVALDGQESCLKCHATERRFPEVSTDIPQYCGLILNMALNATMPPPLHGPGVNSAYSKHIAALREACKRPPSGGIVVNGATQSEPTSSRVDTVIPLTTCTGGPDCPPGFCYWKTLHGPFLQTSPSTVPIGDTNYRGSFARIYTNGNKWEARILSDPTGGPPQAPPGGTLECVNYNQIVTVPDQNKCGTKMFTVFDPDGTKLSQIEDASLNGGLSANVLSGIIGNAAQEGTDRRDNLRVFESGGKVSLMQSHSPNPPPPLKPGPMTGESWTHACSGWTPVFEAKDVLSTSDVVLVPAAIAKDVRCYITGINGAWSSTRANGTVQPFAEIYQGPSGDLRLRVSPIDGKDRAGAYASCVRIR